MKKKLFVFLGVLLAVLITVYLTTGYPVVLNKFPEEVINIENGQLTINPLEEVDFSFGKNIAYLYFSDVDRTELPATMGKHKLYTCDDNARLQDLKNHFQFILSDGDIATAESRILVYSNGELVLNTGFVITDSLIGIQSSKTGWADAVNTEYLKKVIFRFKPVNSPIVKF